MRSETHRFGAPILPWFIGRELSIQHVFSHGVVVIGFRSLYPKLFVHDATKTYLLHESGNAVTGGFHALLAEFIRNPGTAVTTLAFTMHLSDVVHQLILVLLSGTNRMLAPIVIPTAAAGRPRHIQYLTHPLRRSDSQREIGWRFPL